MVHDSTKLADLLVPSENRAAEILVHSVCSLMGSPNPITGTLCRQAKIQDLRKILAFQSVWVRAEKGLCRGRAIKYTMKQFPANPAS